MALSRASALRWQARFMRSALPNAPATSSSRPTVWILRDWMQARRPALECFITVFPVFQSDLATRRKHGNYSNKAVKLAPNGLDAWYFYGDFLYAQNELPKATEVFQHALKISQHPDRPLWDKNRRLVIEELLAKIEEKR